MMSGESWTHAIVRVEPGKERRVSEDLEDFLYPYDQSVSARPTRYNGLVLLRCRLGRGELLRLIESSGVGYVRGVKVLDGLVPLSDWAGALRVIMRLVPAGGAINLKVRVRGGERGAEAVLHRLCAGLERAGYALVSEGGVVVELETIDGCLAISVRNT
ncbi:MAG: hypothetical protein DRJ56_07510 [Thermoprotei archaeon]|nr:MAG: hypothetical protein DRJ56_07510 [Thermoprotei archaeon]